MYKIQNFNKTVRETGFEAVKTIIRLMPLKIFIYSIVPYFECHQRKMSTFNDGIMGQN